MRGSVPTVMIQPQFGARTDRSALRMHLSTATDDKADTMLQSAHLLSQEDPRPQPRSRSGFEHRISCHPRADAMSEPATGYGATVSAKVCNSFSRAMKPSCTALRAPGRLLKKDFERATQRKSFRVQLISARKWGVFGKFEADFPVPRPRCPVARTFSAAC
ncbi:hypothetical protein [Paracoccus versutus]|uniref:hypothetical protein n=2 Tax=Paracoccus TaxID=265 RepID=UPI001FB57FD7|nr:hypothetical protein [Paracoccus versutus]